VSTIFQQRISDLGDKHAGSFFPLSSEHLSHFCILSVSAVSIGEDSRMSFGVRGKKVNISLLQAVEAHRVARG
jgi:hypothetical protein